MGIIVWWIYGSLALAAATLAWGVARVFWPPRLPKVEEGVCAACRYPVRGLGDWKCPECGTDLRVGGILTPRLRHRARARLSGGIVSWVVLMVLLGLFAAQLSVARMVREVAMQASIAQQSIVMMSLSGEYRSLEYSVALKDPGDGGAVTEEARLALPFGEPLEIGKDVPSAEAILGWMSAQGVDTGEPDVAGEAASAARIIRASRQGAPIVQSGFAGLRTSSFRRAAGPVTYRYDINPWLYVMGAVWLAVFVGGVWLMVWVRGRQRRAINRAA